VVVDEGDVKVTQGAGRFIPTPPNSPFVYWRIREREKLGILGRPPPKTDFIEPTAMPLLSASPRSEPDYAAGAAVASVTNGRVQVQEKVNQDDAKILSRGNTASGARNLQDSSFNVSGHQIDDDKPIRMGTTRVQQPPGGKSAGGFW
ncbi:unnamed protein product, partial [Cyprideis torosa]